MLCWMHHGIVSIFRHNRISEIPSGRDTQERPSKQTSEEEEKLAPGAKGMERGLGVLLPGGV